MPSGKVGKETRSLGEALFPKVKRQLLARFLTSPEKQYYGREISRMIEGSHGSVRRELEALVDAGILSSERRGRHQYYWANPNCMIFEELRGIVTKTFGAVGVIGAALSSVGEKIVSAVIFGSVAAGTDTASSDIDLLVVGDVSLRELAVALSEAERELGRTINPVLFTPEEFRSKRESDNHFVRTILESEKLFIAGTPDDLGSVAG